MNFYERLHAVLHGGEPDAVPFAPYDNLVPRGGFERELADRGMGLLDRHSGGIWSEMPNVEIDTRSEGNVVTTTYHTPVGAVYTRSKTHLGRIADGATVQTEGLIKDVKDFDAVIYMVEDTVYHLDPRPVLEAQRHWGSHGYLSQAGFGVPYEATLGFFGGYAGIPAWIYAQNDHPDEFAALVAAVDRRERRRFPLLLQLPGDLVACGSVDGNYGPARWRQYDLPYYQEFVPQLQAAGKIVSIHAHASNNLAYADLLRETGVNVVEAFTPPPVGDLSIAEARRRWGPDVVIWVNFPETVFYYGCEETRRYTMDLIKSDPPGNRLVIGFTEMGTYGITDAESERLFKAGFRAVVEAIETCGAYPVRA